MVVQLFNGLEMDFVMTQLILLNAIMMEVIVVAQMSMTSIAHNVYVSQVVTQSLLLQVQL